MQFANGQSHKDLKDDAMAMAHSAFLSNLSSFTLTIEHMLVVPACECSLSVHKPWPRSIIRASFISNDCSGAVIPYSSMNKFFTT